MYACIRKSGPGGFTVLEMMVVVALISVLLLAFLPSLQAVSQSFSRRSAVDNLLGIFERARVAAIERNRDAHVIFSNADPAFGNDLQPEKDVRYRAYRLTAETEEGGMEPITPWIYLPRGFCFRSEIPSLVSPAEQNANRFFTDYLGISVADLPGVTFTANGSIKAPATLGLLKLFLYEGRYQNSRDTPKKSGPQSRFCDVFTVARLTGRTQWESLFLALPSP